MASGYRRTPDWVRRTRQPGRVAGDLISNGKNKRNCWPCKDAGLVFDYGAGFATILFVGEFLSRQRGLAMNDFSLLAKIKAAARLWPVCALLLFSACAAPAHPPIRDTSIKPQIGMASWYGPGLHGGRTANGETFDQSALTAAHRTLPLGSLAEVTNVENGRKVVVRVNDRGPYAKGRVIDLSRAAAEALGFVDDGHARVEIRALDPSSAAAKARPQA